MNGLVVVDASLTVKWLLSEVLSDKALSLAQAWANQGIRPLAPYLMPVEVANVLHRRVVRNELTVTMAVRLMDTLMASGIELREPPRLHVRALELARRLGQAAAYDAHYLALAESLNCALWTADERFFRAAGSGLSPDAPGMPPVRWLGHFAAGAE